MKKVIPFTTATEGRPQGSMTATGSVVARDGVDTPVYHSTEQLLLLVQRLLGCSSNQELIKRFMLWATELRIADGAEYRATPESETVFLGNRRNHSAQYELTLDQIALGSVTLFRRERYSEDELLLIEQALGALARSLRLAEEVAELHSLATHDALTGLGNRSALDDMLPKETSRTRRHNIDLSVMLIDVDHFKGLNDRLGHAGGDQILRCIAEVFNNSTRASDLAYRYGGDEFVILLPHTDLVSAEIVARQIRTNIGRLSDAELHITEAANGLRPDVSIGIAAYRHGDTEESLLRRADTHLYHAKAMGRGCVCSSL